MSDDEIEALHDPTSWAVAFDAPAQAALALADAMSGPTAQLEPALLQSMREHFSEVERAELLLVCGQANLNNRAGNVAKQLLGDEAAPDA